MSHQGRTSLASNNPFRDTASLSGPSSATQETYAPPQGPPPSRTAQEDYAPPPGPPPSKNAKAPAGNDEEAPPPAYEPWLAVPDNALLPPPPSFGHEYSSTGNANYDDAAAAHAWIRHNPLWGPRHLTPAESQQVAARTAGLVKPVIFQGSVRDGSAPSTFVVENPRNRREACLLSNLPLYSAIESRPHQPGQKATAYFEIKIERLGKDADRNPASIAIGFAAPPWPSWRFPGWHRGSLGVHGDDGHRYLDDSYGGEDFTEAFRAGETIGIGIELKAIPGISSDEKKSASSQLEAKVIFTRNGQHTGGWNIHGEHDRDTDKRGDIVGLEGHHDLYAAVGVVGEAVFSVKFGSKNWLFRPT